MGLGISSAYAYWSVLLPFSFVNIFADPPYDRYGFHLKAGQCTNLLSRNFMTVFLTYLPYSATPGGVLSQAGASKAGRVEHTPK